MKTQTLYDSFAQHYDSVVGPRGDVARYLHRLIKRYHPKAKSVLELGCGSGSMLSLLAKHYRAVGIDSSKGMLQLAKQKAPQAKLIHGDITNFNLNQRFDVVLCPFDTINHVTSFNAWKRVFSLTHKHLAPGGVFVFDVNTEHKMEGYRNDPVNADVLQDEVSIVQVSRSKRFHYTVHLKLFKRRSGRTFTLHEMHLPELVVPTPKVTAALANFFRTITLVDPDRARPNAYTEELYFVCRDPR
jgi:SAM-dependent methyltransferase